MKSLFETNRVTKVARKDLVQFKIRQFRYRQKRKTNRYQDQQITFFKWYFFNVSQIKKLIYLTKPKMHTRWKSRGRVHEVFAHFLGRVYIGVVNFFGEIHLLGVLYFYCNDKFCIKKIREGPLLIPPPPLCASVDREHQIFNNYHSQKKKKNTMEQHLCQRGTSARGRSWGCDRDLRIVPSTNFDKFPKSELGSNPGVGIGDPKASLPASRKRCPSKRCARSYWSLKEKVICCTIQK